MYSLWTCISIFFTLSRVFFFWGGGGGQSLVLQQVRTGVIWHTGVHPPSMGLKYKKKTCFSFLSFPPYKKKTTKEKKRKTPSPEFLDFLYTIHATVANPLFLFPLSSSSLRASSSPNSRFLPASTAAPTNLTAAKLNPI